MTTPEVRLWQAPHDDIARNVILIGASVGGIQAIGELLSDLPPELDAAVAVTLHRSPSYQSQLAELLGRRSRIEVVEARSGQLFAPGRVYLAPPDQHLVFGGGLVLLSHGAREGHSRPSIDVMFRSGAKNYGGRVIGVVLTGNLRDGVEGLKAIKRHGGLSIVQEPAEAKAPSMPLNAVADDGVDIVFRLSSGARVLASLVAGNGVTKTLETSGTRRPDERSALDS